MNNDIINFHKAEDNFFSLVSFSRKKYGSLIAYTTGVQASGLNPAIVHHVDDTFKKNIIDCKSFYTAKALPWALVLPDYLDKELINIYLKQHGLDFTGVGVGMSALIADIICPEFDNSLIAKEISGDLSTWSVPLIHGFESTSEITGIYTQRHELASQVSTNLHHFSGFLNGEVVCSLSLSVGDGYARIDDVATIPAFQKKGYATQLIYTALNYAKQLNVTSCYLEASETGLAIYKRIGFKTLFTNHYYELSTT